jgi:hypothetical protein
LAGSSPRISPVDRSHDRDEEEPHERGPLPRSGANAKSGKREIDAAAQANADAVGQQSSAEDPQSRRMAPPKRMNVFRARCAGV